jgi:hypothetical protein
MGPTELITEFRASDIVNPTGGTVMFERFRQPTGTNTPNRETAPPAT